MFKIKFAWISVGNKLWVVHHLPASRYGVYGNNIAVDGSGNVYVTHSGRSDDETYDDYFITKYDGGTGDELWVARYNGPGSWTDEVRALDVDDLGNVYVTGIASYPSPPDNRSYATVKYDTNGNQLWSAVYNPGRAHDIAVDGSGNVYVTGIIKSGGINRDYGTIKYDSDGNLLWVVTYNGPRSDNDAAFAMALDSWGNVYVTGESVGIDTYKDYATIKYDGATGSELWVTRYDGPGSDYDYDVAFDIAVDSSGDVYVTGESAGTGSVHDPWAVMDYATIKYDGATGAELWVARYDGPGNYDDAARDIELDRLGNVYVTGYSYSGDLTHMDYATIKYDGASGEELWVARYGNTAGSWDGAKALAVDDLGNVYVTGHNGVWATIKYIQFNTPVGEGIRVVATDPETGELTPVTVTFGNVTAPGDTTATTSSTGPPVPNTFMLGKPPTFFDITATAVYEPPVTVCMDYSEIQFGNEDKLEIWQWTGTGWVDITVSRDTLNDVICGQTSSLSVFAIVEPNYPPTADAGGSYSVDEGNSIVVVASGSDPEGDPVTFAWDLDNDGIFETPGQSIVFSAVELDGESSQTITVQVTDTIGLTATAQTTVDVLNVPPTVGEITGLPVDPIEVNTEINASAAFTDPGVLDTHTAVWHWGDGETTTVMVAEGSRLVTRSHTYTTVGVYSVRLTVTDDDSGSGESIFQYVVVYNPEAGFVTGGGWIDSPEGAYVPDLSLISKATFGFVSKYKKGAMVPSGQTEFQFKVAGLSFHSDAYEWLVIAGAQAKYKGTGTINGEGNYGFMLTAIDANLTPSTDVDRFRIKIWDKDKGDEIVYDNKHGESDDSNETTELGGGSIVIHNK